LEQLVEVAVGVEIDLEGLETSRFLVAQRMGSNLGGECPAPSAFPCRQPVLFR
jgi:hypothetical protein